MRSLSPLHGRGTVYRRPSQLHRRFSLSDDSSRHFCSGLTGLTFAIDCVKCPCSVFRDNVTTISTCLNNNTGSLIIIYLIGSTGKTHSLGFSFRIRISSRVRVGVMSGRHTSGEGGMCPRFVVITHCAHLLLVISLIIHATSRCATAARPGRTAVPRRCRGRQHARALPRGAGRDSATSTTT